LITVGAAKVVGMADPFTPDAFYASAREFALSALEAHHAGNHRRVPLDAGTALEHLAKACLARRSRALLAELRNESSVNSVITLLGIEGAGAPAKVRIVGLSEALSRIRRFVKSKADRDDLQILTDLRNGIVHAAEDTEVEERILTAFVQQADSLLADLRRERERFWGDQLPVVNALLADASNKVKHRVRVRLAAAEAMVDRRYKTEGEAVIHALRALSKSAPLKAGQSFRDCPVCGSDAIATGEHIVELVPDDWDKETGDVTQLAAEVWFTAHAFRCPVCNLRLDSGAEIEAAGIDTAWQIEDADPKDYGHQDDEYDFDADYERWREDNDG
jgi:hypothetical protein